MAHGHTPRTRSSASLGSMTGGVREDMRGACRLRAMLLAIAFGVGVVAVAGVAHAQTAPEPFTVDYQAPSACPSAAAFFDEVTARTPRARAAAGGEKARVLHVRVDKRGETHSGRLWIEDNGATSSAREVSGGSCGEVVGALGLVAALAVDPSASVAPRPLPAAATATTPAPATADISATEPPKAEERRPPVAQEPTNASAERPPEVSSSAPQRGAPSRWTAGAGVEVSGVAGAVGLLRVFGEVDLGGRVFAPSFRVAASRSLPVDRAALLGSANLTWTHGTIDLCPIRFDLATKVAARPCAGITLGVLEAEGSGIAVPKSEIRAWLAASVQGRVAWAPARALVVELEVGALAPMLRESFFFDPNVLVYQAPAIAGFGRVALGVRFP